MESTLIIRRHVYIYLLACVNFCRYLIVNILFFVYPSFIKTLAVQILNIDIDTGKPEEIRIVDEYKFWTVFASGGRIGLAEAYVKGYFECDRLDILYFNIVRGKHVKYVKYLHPYVILRNVLYKLFDSRVTSTVWEMGGKHYDIGTKLYECFLGPTMTYSCGYWLTANDLDSAQIEKMKLIARKLHLRPGMKVLDIGCGFGSLAKFLASNYQVEVVGITVSVEHANYARKYCKNTSVEIRLQDYRDINEQFDRIVAVEMLEHIGVNNYRDFFKIIRDTLTEDGLFLLHCIGINHTDLEPFDIFLNEHMFLNMHFPSIEQIAKFSTDLLVIEDLHNFGNDFSLTVNAWFKNFQKSWPSLENSYDKEFYRLWTHYFLCSSGVFKARKMHVWHIVFSKNGVIDGYASHT